LAAVKDLRPVFRICVNTPRPHTSNGQKYRDVSAKLRNGSFILPGASRNVHWPIGPDDRFAPVPGSFVKIERRWYFRQRKLMVDWIDSRPLRADMTASGRRWRACHESQSVNVFRSPWLWAWARQRPGARRTVLRESGYAVLACSRATGKSFSAWLTQYRTHALFHATLPMPLRSARPSTRSGRNSATLKVLLYNAGSGVFADFDDATPEQFEKAGA